ncbi:MAG: hypothetical protein FWD48_06695 [Oscillospiraceae bacterium]|nr:hypothetical protein [Oscillospiraceae bacterium]
MLIPLTFIIASCFLHLSEKSESEVLFVKRLIMSAVYDIINYICKNFKKEQTNHVGFIGRLGRLWLSSWRHKPAESENESKSSAYHKADNSRGLGKLFALLNSSLSSGATGIMLLATVLTTAMAGASVVYDTILDEDSPLKIEAVDLDQGVIFDEEGNFIVEVEIDEHGNITVINTGGTENDENPGNNVNTFSFADVKDAVIDPPAIFSIPQEEWDEIQEEWLAISEEEREEWLSVSADEREEWLDRVIVEIEQTRIREQTDESYIPTMTNPDTPDVTTAPPVTTTPPITTPAPEVTTSAPEVTTTAPELTTTPPVTTTTPPVTTTTPPVTTTTPPVTTTTPPITTTTPSVTTTTPQITTTTPQVTTTTAPPVTTTTQPPVTTTRTPPVTTTRTPPVTTTPPPVKADQTGFAIVNPGEFTFGDAPVTLTTAGGQSTGAVTWAVTVGNAVSVAPGTGMMIIESAGEVTITATKAGDNDYNPTADSITLTIGKRDLSNVSITAITSVIYTGLQHTPTPSVTDGANNIITIHDYTVSWGANITVASGGTVTITATAGGNYTGSRTVSFDIGKATPSYIEPIGLTATYGDLLSSVSLPPRWGWDSPDDYVGNAGERIHSATFTPADIANYNTVTIDLIIDVAKAEQAEFNINDPGLILFGGNDFWLTTTGGSTGGPVEFEILSGASLSVSPVGFAAIESEGDTLVMATMAGDENYNEVTATRTISVGKRNLSYVSASVPWTFVYNGLPYTPSPDVTDITGTENMIKPTDFTYTHSNNTNAGTATITITATPSGNYTGEITIEFDIDKAPLTVTADNLSKSFGAATPTFTFTIAGYVNGESRDTPVIGNITGIPSLTTDYNNGYPVNNYTIFAAVGSLEADNYEFVVFNDGVLAVEMAEQSPQISITGAPSQIIYGDPGFTLSVSGGSGTGTAIQWAVTGGDGAVSINANGDVTINHAGTSTIRATKEGDSNFSFAEATITLTVAEQLITDTMFSVNSVTYNGSPQQPTVTATGLVRGVHFNYTFPPQTDADTYDFDIFGIGNYSGTIQESFEIRPASVTVAADNHSVIFGSALPSYTYKLEHTLGASYTPSGITGLPLLTSDYTSTSNIGTLPITINVSGMSAQNYIFTPQNGTITITARDISDATVTIGGTFTYTGSAQTPVPTVVVNGVTLEHNTDFTILHSNNTNAGTATVTITGIGNYSGTASENFNIGRANLIITANNQSKTFGGITPAFTVTYNAFVGGETASVLGNSLLFNTDYTQGSAVNTYTITPGGLTSDNYDITFVPGTLTVNQRSVSDATVTIGGTFTYTGSAHTPIPTVVVNGVPLVHNTDFIISHSNNTGAGQATVTVTGIGNYTGTASENFNIGRAPLTITADNKSKTFGDTTTPAFTESYSAFVGGESAAVLVGTLLLNSNYIQGNAAGTYTITPSGLTSDNYNITFVNGTLTVNRRSINDATVTIGGTFTYTGAAQTPVPTVEVNGVALVHNTDFTISYSANTGAGTATATITGIGNYTGTASENFQIGRANLIITANNQSKTFGDATTPAFTVSYNAFVGGETAASLTGTLSFNTDYTLGSAVNTYTITPDGLTSDNYDISFVNGTLTVNERSVSDATVTIGGTFTYTGSAHTPVPTVEVNGVILVLDTDFTISHSNNTGAGQATVTVTGIGNYTGTASGSFQIGKATPPTVTFPSASAITYGQTLADSTLSGGSGDGTFAWNVPTTVPIVSNGGFNVRFTPNDTDNYDYTDITLTQTTAITVNPAELTITASGTLSPIDTVTLTLSGRVGTDTIALTAENLTVTNTTLSLPNTSTFANIANNIQFSTTNNNYIIPSTTAINIRDGREVGREIHVQQANITRFNEFARTEGANGGLNRSYILVQNINLNGIFWTPIGTEANPFTGVFNGDGCTVSEISLHRGAMNYVGMFGNTEAPAVIKNLGIIGVDTMGGRYIGGIAGRNGGTIENCFVRGTFGPIATRLPSYLLGTEYVGGIAGDNQDGIIRNCVSLLDSINTSANNPQIGRVSGSTAGTFVNNYAWGDTRLNGKPVITGTTTANDRNGQCILRSNAPGIQTDLNTVFGAPSTGNAPNLNDYFFNTVWVDAPVWQDFETLSIALDFIGTTAGTYEMFLKRDQALANRTIGAGQNITILENEDEFWTVIHNGTAEQHMFTIDGGGSLRLNNRITLQGRATSGSGTVVTAANGTLTMQSGSRITGHNNDQTTNGAVHIGANGTLVMNGGAITDNIGVDVNISEGRSITLSGNATIDELRLNATNATDNARITVSTWSGKIDTLNLRGAPANWNDRQILFGTTFSPVAFPLGIFVDTGVPIADTHSIDNGGFLRLHPTVIITNTANGEFISSHATLALALDSITTAGNYTVTINEYQTLANHTIGAGQNITLVGVGDERTITHTGTDSEVMFTLGNSGAALTLGNNITLQGRDSVTHTTNLINITNGTLTMEADSKITGHRTTVLSGAVRISGENAHFIMNGGIITGNISSNTTTEATGGMLINTGGGTTVTLNGGSITGNTPTDICAPSAASNSLRLSSTANIGIVILGSINNARADITVNAGWTGSINTLHLRRATAVLAEVVEWWGDEQILTGGGVANAITENRITLGNFRPTGAATQPITDTHFIDSNGFLRPNPTVLVTGSLTGGYATLEAALNAIGTNTGTYTVTLHADQTLAPYTFDTANQNITLVGDGGVRTVTLSAIGSMFTLDGGATLTLDDNITLTGRSDNNRPVMQIYSGSKVTMNDGAVITGNTTSEYGGAILIRGVGSEFIMNGGTITGNTANEYGGAILISDLGSEFIMNGGTITGNTAELAGGGLFINAGSKFTMNGGAITNNTSAAGGGIYTFDPTTNFNTIIIMNDGEISNNTATGRGDPNDPTNIAGVGGGVGLRGGVFEMNGGTIKDNTGRAGGGVSISLASTFNMTGGSITNNTHTSSADGNGGGVSAAGVNVTFNMSGGEISRNSSNTFGGGVSVGSGAVFNMSGDAAIFGNESNAIGLGGGVSVVNSIFNMSEDAVIYGNTAIMGAGLFVNGAEAEINISGGLITGNDTTGADPAANIGTNQTPNSSALSAVSGVVGNVRFGTHSGGSFTPVGGIHNESRTIEVRNGVLVRPHISAVSITTNGSVPTWFPDATTALFTARSLLSGEHIVTLHAPPDGAAYHSLTETITFASQRPNVNTTIQGDGTERELRYIGNSARLVVNSASTTLTLGNNLKMVGGSVGAPMAGVGPGRLIMNDGATISGNMNSSQSGGVNVNSNGTFDMYGGTITGNSVMTDNSSGGVYVNSNGTFNMRGGEITGNITTPSGAGGGVTVVGSGVFNISDGRIAGVNADKILGAGYPANVSPAHAALFGTANYGTFSGNTFNPVGSISNENRTIVVENGVLIHPNTAIVTVSVNGGTHLPYNSLADALASITTIGEYEVELYADQSLANVRLEVAGANIRLIGMDGEQEIRLSADSAMFTVNGGSLTLGENITLVGRNPANSNGAGNHSPVVSVINNGTFTMLTGSKITGHLNLSNSASATAAVNVAGGTFNLRGGEISGNAASSSTVVLVTGGLFVSFGGRANLENGIISGNTATGGDVFLQTFINHNISGNTEIGTLTLEASQNTNESAVLEIAPGWSGSIDTLNLYAHLTSIQDVRNRWNDRTAMTGAFDITKIMNIGSFVCASASAPPQPILDMHFLDENGVIRQRGTAEQPFIITTEAQLRLIGTQIYPFDAHYRLENDIEIQSALTITAPFEGVFDGNGHTISNANISAANGLFMNVGGTVKNLGVINVNINSTAANVGGIANSLSGGGVITSCFVTGNITNNLSFGRAGGIVGVNEGIVENSYSTANITSNNIGGGIAGANFGSATIRYCYATGIISGTQNVGGIVGSNSTGSTINCAALNSAITRSSGDLTTFGRVTGWSTGTLTNNYANSSMTLPSDITPNSAFNSIHGFGTNIANFNIATAWTGASSWSGGAWSSTIWDIADGRLPLLRAFPAPPPPPPPLGSAENPFKVNTEAQLRAIGTAEFPLTAHYKLEEDITLTSNWTEIAGTFTGTFDGNGHTITGLTGTRGIFQAVSGTVKDLGLENVNINGTLINVGGITRRLESGGLISGCYVTGSVSNSTAVVGGIAGQNNGTIENSFSAANVSNVSTMSGTAGGIVGENNSSGIIRYCYATGTISGIERVGGIVGYNAGTIINCAALNTSLVRIGTGTATSFGRVVGTTVVSTGTLANNYGLTAMPIPVSISGTLTNNHGASQTFNTATRWTDTTRWDGAPWDETIWDIADGRLPLLRVFGGISGASLDLVCECAYDFDCDFCFDSAEPSAWLLFGEEADDDYEANEHSEPVALPPEEHRRKDEEDEEDDEEEEPDLEEYEDYHGTV